MNYERIQKTVMEWKSIGIRPRGRPLTIGLIVLIKEFRTTSTARRRGRKRQMV